MQPNPSTLGDVKLSYRFILLGLISINVFSLLFFPISNTLREGLYRVNDVWTLVHIFILGFIIMIVMGVMYQLVPVALLVPIFSNKLSRVQFWFYAAGVIGLALSLYFMNTLYILTFGIVTLFGILLFVANILLSTKKIIEWNMMSLIIITAVIYLFLTVLFGVGLAVNYYNGYWAEYHENIFYSHLLFGLIGWLSSLIIGFSYKMVPMFSLAHGYKENYAKYIYLCLQSGIMAIVVGLFTELVLIRYIGLFLIITAFILFTIQIREIMRNKMKTRLDIGFTAAVNSIYLTAGLVSIAPLGFYFWQESFVLPFAYLFITGWIGLSLLGYLFKIVPFLWWTDKYSDRVGKEDVPLLKDMVDEQKGKIAFLLILSGILGNSLGIGLNLQVIIMISSLIFMTGGVLYSFLVLRVFKM